MFLRVFSLSVCVPGFPFFCDRLAGAVYARVCVLSLQFSGFPVCIFRVLELFVPHVANVYVSCICACLAWFVCKSCELCRCVFLSIMFVHVLPVSFVPVFSFFYLPVLFVCVCVCVCVCLVAFVRRHCSVAVMRA